MGRPTFTIDRMRLRDLRAESGKTLLTVAKELHEKLGKKNHPSTDATLTNDYQRIERTGRTSRQRAEALAGIFGVTVEVLQGKGAPEPVAYLARISALLRERLSNNTNVALIRALDRFADNGEPSDESIASLAEDIGRQIEAAQLGRNPAELAELAELTGLPESELLKPANVEGYWLVIANGRGIHHTKLVHGVAGVVWEAREIGEKLHWRGSDGSVRMFRDEPWFRVELGRGRDRKDVIRIDFVRCAPTDGTGIRWVKATWRDRFMFEHAFKTWAYSVANFVTDFDGHQSPAGDVRRLRLLVTEYERSTYRPTGRMVISGYLEELHAKTFESFRQENSTHALVQNWLIGDLKRALSPYFAEHPRQCWQIRRCAQQVVIDLDEYRARKRPILDCHHGIKYSIDLLEEVADHEFASVPWRDKDVEFFQQDLTKMLDDPNDRFWTSDDPCRTFEPFVTEG